MAVVLVHGARMLQLGNGSADAVVVLFSWCMMHYYSERKYRYGEKSIEGTDKKGEQETGR